MSAKHVILSLFCGVALGTSTLAISTLALERNYKEGLQLLKQRHFALASDKLRQALKNEADNAEIWFALGVSLYQQQDLLGAYQAYKAGLRLFPNAALQARLRSGLGDIHFDQQDFGQAIPAYLEALNYQSGWSGVRLKLATALLREQRFEEALFHSKALQQQSLAPAESLYLQGLIYLAQQNVSEAIPILEKLASYPEHTFNARQMLIWLYQKNHEAAYTANKAALKTLSKDYPEVYRVIGFSESQRYFSCYLDTAQACTATDYLASLQKWQLSGFNTDSAYLALGTYHQINHQWEQAELAFLRAHQIFPEHADYMLRAWLMKKAQNKMSKQAPWQSLQLSIEEAYSWRELSAWSEEIKGSLALPTEFQVNTGLTLFWHGFFQQPWYAPPTVEVQRKWKQAEKEMKEGAEKKIIQAWRLWLAGERKWALTSLEAAQAFAPDWWLPYALWSLFADQTEGVSEQERQRIIEIAYSLNPVSLKIAQLRFIQPLTPAIEQVYLKEVLTTFPEHEPFQYRYLQQLQDKP